LHKANTPNSDAQSNIYIVTVVLFQDNTRYLLMETLEGSKKN